MLCFLEEKKALLQNYIVTVPLSLKAAQFFVLLQSRKANFIC